MAHAYKAICQIQQQQPWALLKAAASAQYAAWLWLGLGVE
jgi:hypothetical protein